MINPYQQIIAYNDDEWYDFLDRAMLLDIFMPVIEEYKDPQVLKCVIRYIVYAYSLQSEHLVVGMEWQKNKQKIFEYVMAKPIADAYESLVLLQNKAVVQSIHNWLKFQDNNAFTHIQVLRDLKVEMQITALSKIIKSSGENDYDQKYRNAEYAGKLQEKIKELESQLVQNDDKMKEAAKEVRTAKTRYNVSPESFSK